MKRRFEIEWKDNEITDQFELDPESLRDILNKELRFTTFTVTKLPKKKLEGLDKKIAIPHYLHVRDKINEIVDRINEV